MVRYYFTTEDTERTEKNLKFNPLRTPAGTQNAPMGLRLCALLFTYNWLKYVREFRKQNTSILPTPN
jgi:hypothetical protein